MTSKKGHRMHKASFFAALDVARYAHDPVEEWEAFCDVAWRELGLADGCVEGERLLEDVP